MASLTRRELLARGSSAAAALWAGPALTGAALAAAASAPVPACWGVYSDGGRQRVERLERLLGRRFAAYRVNSAVDKDAPSPALRAAHDHGTRWTYQNCNLGNQHRPVTK